MSKDFVEYFLDMPDPRVDRTKIYPLTEIIFLTVTAVLSGCEGWKQIKDFGEVKLDWLRRYLPYEAGIPVDDTIARVMRKLNTDGFKERFIAWMQDVSITTNGDVIAVDGKTLRRSHNHKEGQSAIHMVSAWSSANGVVLGQKKTTEKSNEITAIPELLSALELSGCIVTIDAMGCQKNIAKKIIDGGADYVLALKANQGNLRKDTENFFKHAEDTSFAEVENSYHEEFDKGHGRIEKRQCWVAKVDDMNSKESSKWAGLKTIAMIVSERVTKKKTTREVRFFICSLAALCAENTLQCVRKHWGVENSLHWVLDVTFREDESRIRKDSSPENLAIVRHIALNLIKKDSSKKCSVKRKRMFAALDDNYRDALITSVI